MARFTETQRRVTTRRIQEAGAQEQGGISQFLGTGRQGVAEAPSIASILALLSAGPGTDIETIRKAVFSGITEGATPQLMEAMRLASESAAARGVPRSSIEANLRSRASIGVLSPLLLGAQSQFAGLLPTAFNQRIREAGALQGVRGQAFNELAAALQRNLSERSQNATTTESIFQRQAPLLKRLLASAGGNFLGNLLGPVGKTAGKGLLHGLGGLASFFTPSPETTPDQTTTPVQPNVPIMFPTRPGSGGAFA